MKYALTLATLAAAVTAAPLAAPAPQDYASYGTYPEPAGGYGTYAGYGDYPEPDGGYGTYADYGTYDSPEVSKRSDPSGVSDGVVQSSIDAKTMEEILDQVGGIFTVPKRRQAERRDEPKEPLYLYNSFDIKCLFPAFDRVVFESAHCAEYREKFQAERAQAPSNAAATKKREAGDIRAGMQRRDDTDEGIVKSVLGIIAEIFQSAAE